MATSRSLSSTSSRASRVETGRCAFRLSTIWVPMVSTGLSVIIGSWKIMAMRLPRISRSRRFDALVRSSPLNRISPPVMRPGSPMRLIMANAARDLPAPLSPTIPRLPPSSREKLIPLSATSSASSRGKATVRLRTSRSLLTVTSAPPITPPCPVWDSEHRAGNHPAD